MEATAKLKNCHMSARKARLVLDLIRGKSIEEALDILRFTNKEAAEWIEKVLLSAIANWEYKTGGLESADEYDLFISKATADGGMMLKRIRPAPHGRAHRIRKRTCHITIAVNNRTPLPNDYESMGGDVAEVEEIEAATEE